MSNVNIFKLMWCYQEKEKNIYILYLKYNFKNIYSVSYVFYAFVVDIYYGRTLLYFLACFKKKDVRKENG